MAGRIADAEKNRPVFHPRLFKRLIAPGEPIHGIVRVLEQVRRFFTRQAVGVLVNGGLHATHQDNKRVADQLESELAAMLDEDSPCIECMRLIINHAKHEDCANLILSE